MEQISIKGIVVGGIIDWVATLTFTTLLVIYVRSAPGFAHLPTRALPAAMYNDHRLYATQFLIRTACSVIGGYVAGALARRAQILNGVLCVMLPALIGSYAFIKGTYPGALWQLVAGLFVASPLAGALGGYLALLQARQNEVPA